MNWRTLAGSVAVLAVVAAVLGVVGNFAVENQLLFDSTMQAAALVAFGVVAVSLLAFMSLGRPWDQWARTPYW